MYDGPVKNNTVVRQHPVVGFDLNFDFSLQINDWNAINILENEKYIVKIFLQCERRGIDLRAPCWM